VNVEQLDLELRRKTEVGREKPLLCHFVSTNQFSSAGRGHPRTELTTVLQFEENSNSGRVDGLGAIIQAGRSQVRVLMGSMNFLLLILSYCSGISPASNKMSTRRYFRGLARPSRKSDEPIAMCE
jgi:hypothetical protein